MSGTASRYCTATEMDGKKESLAVAGGSGRVAAALSSNLHSSEGEGGISLHWSLTTELGFVWWLVCAQGLDGELGWQLGYNGERREAELEEVRRGAGLFIGGGGKISEYSDVFPAADKPGEGRWAELQRWQTAMAV